MAADLEFHRQIAVGVGQLRARVAGRQHVACRPRGPGVWRGMTEPRAQERTLAEHRAIYQAIMSRDADLARSSAIVHIAGIESWLRTALAD